MSTVNSNKKSYNETEIVNYYTDFNAAGLFHYEEILIEKYFKTEGRTLDIGCGAGRVTIPPVRKRLSDYRNGLCRKDDCRSKSRERCN